MTELYAGHSIQNICARHSIQNICAGHSIHNICAGHSIQNICTGHSTVFAVFHELLVHKIPEPGVSGEADSVPRHGEPRADSEQHTLRVLTYEVLQHRRVIDKGVQFSVQTKVQCKHFVQRICLRTVYSYKEVLEFCRKRMGIEVGREKL